MFREPLAQLWNVWGSFAHGVKWRIGDRVLQAVHRTQKCTVADAVGVKDTTESQLATSVEKFAELIGYVLPASSFGIILESNWI